MSETKNLKNCRVTIDGKECELVGELRPIMDNIIRAGQSYFYLDSFNRIRSFVNANGIYDTVYCNNYLVRTQEDAEKLKRLKELQAEYAYWCSKYPVDWKNDSQIKYFLFFDHDDYEIEIDNTYTTQYDISYCANADHLQKFIDNHSEEDLLLLLGVTAPQRCFLEGACENL